MEFKKSRHIGLFLVYVYALMLVVLSLCQLFTFDDFTVLVGNTWQSIGAERIVASLIVICEVFALPFLLRLNLGRAVRAVSAIFSLIVPMYWLLAILFGFSRGVDVGLFGSLATVEAGLLSLILAVCLFIVAIGSNIILAIFIRKNKYLL